MSHKTVCRVCSADNGKMYSIADTELQEVYEKLTNISLHADNRPLTVCYVCHSQLRITWQLMLKAFKVEEILIPILTGEVQLSTLDRQAHKLTSSLSVSHTEHMSTGMPVCSTVIKEEPPEVYVEGGDQQEPTWRETNIKAEPVSGNSSNELNSEGDTTQTKTTGVPERRLTRNQKTYTENDARISFIKQEPVGDHHNSLWEADAEGDALQSYDIEFLVRRETTKVATYARKRKAAPLELKPKLRQPEYTIKKEPPEMLQETENAGTSAHDEETYINVSNTTIVTKTSSELDLECITYICNECNRVFDSKKNLRKHTWRHLRLKITNNAKNKLEISKRYKCCKFNEKGYLRVHRRTHTGDKPHACHMCNYKCNHKSNLRVHLRTHTGEKPYACHLCDYKGTQLSQLKSHLRTHTGEKPYACHLCDYKGTQLTQIKSHLKTHTGERQYACHLCDLKYKHNSSLQIHLRTHTGENPYACHLCDFKFTTKGRLQTHLRKHTGEKPYACYVCDYKSTQSNNLKTHLRTHTGRGQYACHICDYKSDKMGYLRAHLRMHTGDQPYACLFQKPFRNSTQMRNCT